MNNELESRAEELSREFSEQVKLLQAHYEGRMAEVKRLMERGDNREDGNKEHERLPS